MPRTTGPRVAAVGVDAFKTWNATLAAMAANESAHNDHANQAAARWLVLPTPLPCLLAPSVTTPLYTTPSPKRYHTPYEVA